MRTALGFGDTAMLLLLFVQLTLGLATIPVSLKFINGCAMVKFMTCAQGIVTLGPVVAVQIAGVPLVCKLHPVLGMTILLVFPFTRAVNAWRLPG